MNPRILLLASAALLVATQFAQAQNSGNKSGKASGNAKQGISSNADSNGSGGLRNSGGTRGNSSSSSLRIEGHIGKAQPTVRQSTAAGNGPSKPQRRSVGFAPLRPAEFKTVR